MLIDLLSTENVESFNCKLANIIGLKESIYIQQIINISEKATRKGKLLEGGFFVLDREYIQSRTTITVEEQLAIDDKLNKLGILEIGSVTGSMKLDLTAVTALFVEGNEKIVGELKVKSSRKTKSESIVYNLKKNVIATNAELISAYYDWIDSVLAKEGWMSATAVREAQTIVDASANHNLDVALEIIHIASINGYRDMQWAVNKYAQKRTQTNILSQAPIASKVATAVSGEEF